MFVGANCTNFIPTSNKDADVRGLDFCMDAWVRVSDQRPHFLITCI